MATSIKKSNKFKGKKKAMCDFSEDANWQNKDHVIDMKYMLQIME